MVKTYQNVSLPIGLIEEIDKFVKNSKRYQSRSEFVKEAVRNHLREQEK
jgi:metal-responsive CopG/Arc/MetJ family transcriptional regulator